MPRCGSWGAREASAYHFQGFSKSKIMVPQEDDVSCEPWVEGTHLQPSGTSPGDGCLPHTTSCPAGNSPRLVAWGQEKPQVAEVKWSSGALWSVKKKPNKTKLSNFSASAADFILTPPWPHPRDVDRDGSPFSKGGHQQCGSWPLHAVWLGGRCEEEMELIHSPKAVYAFSSFLRLKKPGVARPQHVQLHHSCMFSFSQSTIPVNLSFPWTWLVHVHNSWTFHRI